jgi:hypothetical protein
MLLFGPSLAFVRLMLPLATGLASLPVARALLVGALLVRATVGFERAAGFAAAGLGFRRLDSAFDAIFFPPPA